MKLNLSLILRYVVPALVALLSTYAKRAVAATRSLGRFSPALACAALLALTSCISIDPLPGFHYDSRIDVEAPATIDAEANLRADVVQLACYALDLVGFADDVPACALYAPVPEPQPEPAPMPVEPVEPVAFTPSVSQAGAILPGLIVSLPANASVYSLLLAFFANLKARVRQGSLAGVEEHLDEVDSFIRAVKRFQELPAAEPDADPVDTDRPSRDRDDD